MKQDKKFDSEIDEYTRLTPEFLRTLAERMEQNNIHHIEITSASYEGDDSLIIIKAFINPIKK